MIELVFFYPTNQNLELQNFCETAIWTIMKTYNGLYKQNFLGPPKNLLKQNENDSGFLQLLTNFP